MSALLLPACVPFGNRPATAKPTAGTPGGSYPLTLQSLRLLEQTEQLLLTTPHPARDLYSLTQRLKLHSARSIPHTGRTTPLNAQLGEEDSFWINNLDTRSYRRIQARLEYITPHVYMYVEDGQSASLAALKSSADTFEKHIYPLDRATFGSEWAPGIDDDPHLTILNAVGLGSGVGGFYSPEDEYPTSVNPYSNEREMFYMNLAGMAPGSNNYNSTLAHEFQHMIHWHLRPVDLTWVNEGMAVLAQHINGYTTGGVETGFLQQPDTQLTDWSDDPNVALAHYGAAYLFMDYFAEHFGGYGILKALLADPAAPPLNFDHVLAQHGYRARFNDVLTQWYLANFIQNYHIDNGQYGYATVQVPGLTPQHTIGDYPFGENDTVHQYAAEYYDIEPAGRHGTLVLNFSGSPVVHMIGNDPYGEANEWWSNRYDNMDSTLTRTFDLSSLKGKHATLQFAAWYDLERDYDYAFVEASTDGVTWATLKGNYTTASNPNGNNWGYGYTGTSGGGRTPRWVQESIDLTPYAGKKIQLRFEEVTDDAVNLQGFALSQIRIPELHFQDTLASDNGWISCGFIRSNNLIPEHYEMDALLYSGQNFSVRRLQIDLAMGRATLTIPDFGRKVTRVVLVVSAYAVETTLPAHYRLVASIR